MESVVGKLLAQSARGNRWLTFVNSPPPVVSFICAVTPPTRQIAYTIENAFA
jgi:hypothetical protein